MYPLDGEGEVCLWNEAAQESADGGVIAYPAHDLYKLLTGVSMKILAMEIETEGVKPEQFAPHLKAEAMRVWELVQSGIIRETYFRADRSAAVMMLECADVDEAKRALESMPLVKEGLIAFEVIPLIPYPGFARLFEVKA